MKRCGFCRFSTEDDSTFKSHLADVHGWNSSQARMPKPPKPAAVTPEQPAAAIPVTHPPPTYGSNLSRVEARSPGLKHRLILGPPLLLLSALVALIALATAITIVGIPVALGLFAIAGGFMRLGMGGAKVICPICAKGNDVLFGKDGFNCRGCKSRVVVEWI